ncbi:hypothetical protein nbrc107696_34420 [Gordonia spumicola]|uniref:Acyl-CoA dehydrogenase C-terminal domain-containing protein n=1 Tax=Gordonia spumicola TaxID=589161 RepID=A0A7I9VC98_9ACTN|nr:hypothetical protein nbrc107696_34420 [Gordonia spumicola]
MVKVSGVKALATTAALNVNSGIFEVIGAARDQSQVRLRPFLRNVRTHTRHDPVAYKIADVGKHPSTGSTRSQASPRRWSSELPVTEISPAPGECHRLARTIREPRNAT